VTPQSDGNTKLEVTVEHLAPPDRVTPNATSYVVWVTPKSGGPAQNMGSLKVDDKLKGELTTVVPFRDFEIQVTPEPNSHATSPTHPEVMQAMVHVPAPG
jgi:hypothetical protein